MLKASNNVADRLIDQAADIYCHHIARVDHLGTNRRIIFTLPCLDSDGYQQVQVKLIVPEDLIPTIINLLASSTERLDQHSRVAVLRSFEPKTAN
jgi:hypothetical protein